jgi:cbb3-type cytochrome oxidase subunit 3
MRALLTTLEAGFWPQISAAVFGLIFVGLALWAFMPQRNSAYREAEQLPLSED